MLGGMAMTRVKTLEQLDALAKERRSVVVPDCYCWFRPRPAAFVINLSGSVLVRLFSRGMYVYEKKK